jgi:hypothetical protein
MIQTLQPELETLLSKDDWIQLSLEPSISAKGALPPLPGSGTVIMKAPLRVMAQKLLAKISIERPIDGNDVEQVGLQQLTAKATDSHPNRESILDSINRADLHSNFGRAVKQQLHQAKSRAEEFEKLRVLAKEAEVNGSQHNNKRE